MGRCSRPSSSALASDWDQSDGSSVPSLYPQSSRRVPCLWHPLWGCLWRLPTISIAQGWWNWAHLLVNSPWHESAWGGFVLMDHSLGSLPAATRVLAAARVLETARALVILAERSSLTSLFYLPTAPQLPVLTSGYPSLQLRLLHKNPFVHCWICYRWCDF